MNIRALEARIVADSRGKPTIEVALDFGEDRVSASVPAGKSVGSAEAVALPADEAVARIRGRLIPRIVGKNFESAGDVDAFLLELDGSADKRNLGANATLGVSVAAARAFARAASLPLWEYIAETEKFQPRMPRLFMNVVNGGVHAGFALPFQEYMIVPKESTMREMYSCAETHRRTVGETLEKRFGQVPLGDEGGYAPRFETLEEPFELLRSVVGDDCDLAIDAAASEFFRDGFYHILERPYSRDELLDVYCLLSVQYSNLLSIEDPFAETDIAGFQKITERIGGGTLIVGDDLTTTNPDTVRRMAKARACTAVIIKPNQIGTLTEACAAARVAHSAGWKCIASHRSGETTDDWIADVAVGIGAWGIKAGSPVKPERVAKYDRLCAIEEEMTPR